MDIDNFKKYYIEVATLKRIIDLIFEKYKNICIYTKNKQNMIIANNTPLIKFIKMLGDASKSKDGENYLAKIILKNNTSESNKFLAVKIVPVRSLSRNLEEVRIMEILRNYMDENEFPIFNYIYYHFICNHDTKFVYQNSNITKTIAEKKEMEKYVKKLKSVLETEYVPNVFGTFKDYYYKVKNLLLEANSVLKNKIEEYGKYGHNSLIILNEYNEGSDLNDNIKNFFGLRQDEKKDAELLRIYIYVICFQVIIGLLIMHSQKIVHMDLHIANIFLRFPFAEESKVINKRFNIGNKLYLNVEYPGIILKISDFSRSYYFGDDTEDINDYHFLKFYKELSRFFTEDFETTNDKKTDKLRKMAVKDNYLLLRIFDFWRFFSNFQAHLQSAIPDYEIYSKLNKFVDDLGDVLVKPNKNKFYKIVFDFVLSLQEEYILSNNKASEKDEVVIELL